MKARYAVKKTRHALARSSQRGIPAEVLELILRYGVPVPKPGDATAYWLRNKDTNRVISDLKQWINLLEKGRNKAIVVSEKGDVLTAYHVETTGDGSPVLAD